MNRLIEKLDDKCAPIFKDDRGRVINFGCFQVNDLHVASMKPGVIRGNHVHDRDEIICIIGGKGICEISVEDNPGEVSERIHVDGNIKTYRIKSGTKHKVCNVGKKEFYLIAFF